ncbi:MAG: MBL fold metallo-hydrolase [Anaerolineae bacterium]
MEILPSIHQLRDPFDTDIWVSVYLLTGTCPALIDTGTAQTPERTVLPYLQQIDLDPREIQVIVCTHHHSDHAGSAAHLKQVTEAEVWAHSKEILLLEQPWQQVEWLRAAYPSYHPYLGKSRAEIERELPREVSVERTVGDGEVISLGDSQWQVLHTPGHTAGIISLYQPEQRWLLTSDAVQAGGTPGGLAYYHDVVAYQATLDRLARVDIWRWLVGHPYQPMLRGVLQGEEIQHFLDLSRQVVDSYDREILKTLQQSAEPMTLGQVTDVLRRRYQCSGPYFLSVATVATHLKELAAQGEIWQLEDGPGNNLYLG